MRMNSRRRRRELQAPEEVKEKHSKGNLQRFRRFHEQPGGERCDPRHILRQCWNCPGIRLSEDNKDIAKGTEDS